MRRGVPLHALCCARLRAAAAAAHVAPNLPLCLCSCLPVLSPTSRFYAWWALLMLLLDLSYTGKPAGLWLVCSRQPGAMWVHRMLHSIQSHG